MASPKIYATFGPLVAAYPHLTAPDSTGQYADDKYKVDLVGAPDSPEMKAVKAETEAAFKAFQLKKGMHVPIKKEEAKNADGDKVPTGNLVLRTKSKFAPTIVDARGKPIDGKALRNLKIEGGSLLRVKGYFGAYDKGMTFTLTDVQVLKLVERAPAFGAWEGEGGFSADDLSGGFGSDSEDEPPFDIDGDDEDDGGLDI